MENKNIQNKSDNNKINNFDEFVENKLSYILLISIIILLILGLTTYWKGKKDIIFKKYDQNNSLNR